MWRKRVQELRVVGDGGLLVSQLEEKPTQVPSWTCGRCNLQIDKESPVAARRRGPLICRSCWAL